MELAPREYRTTDDKECRTCPPIRRPSRAESGCGDWRAFLQPTYQYRVLVIDNPAPGVTKMNASSLVVACCALIAQTHSTENEQLTEPHAPAPILIDWIHANDFSMIGLRPGVYDYHVTCGFRHGFDYLQSRGVEHEYAADGRLTPERLANCKLLFINLASAEREPFLVSEIMAAHSFVAGGGSLLIVTDHSNCYFHSHRLKPLLTEFGIQSFTDTACDNPPHTLETGNGWLAITSFRPHPITQGLHRLGFQTGGIVDPRYAVALTSDRSWADAWSVGSYGEGEDNGFCGDFVQQEHEPHGPHGVVLARDFQKGRIVIVGDQNIWGDAFINYADNYRLWLNTMAWLLRDPNLADWKSYETWHRPRVAFFEPADSPRFGSRDNGDYYNAFCLIARHYWTFANDRCDDPADLRVVAEGRRNFSPAELNSLSEYARAGGKLLVLRDPAESDGEAGDPTRPLTASLDLSGTVQTSTQHTNRYTYPGGGCVVVLGCDQAISNQHLAPPIRAPNAEEADRAELLLDLIRHLLDN